MYDNIAEWTVTLEELGDPTLQVTFQDPQDMEVGVFRRIQDANTIIVRLQRGAPLEDGDMWALTALDEIMGKALLRWNLFDRATKEVLPIGTGIADPFEKVPMPVYRFLIDEFRTRLMELPKSGPNGNVQLRQPRVPGEVPPGVPGRGDDARPASAAG